jgi:hypothetical protein
VSRFESVKKICRRRQRRYRRKGIARVIGKKDGDQRSEKAKVDQGGECHLERAGATTLPMLFIEADASAFARQRIARYRDMGAFRLSAGHDLLKNLMKQLANASPFHLSTLKHCARTGSADAHEVLETMWVEELARDGRVRPQLADYLIDQSNPSLPRRRGRQKASHFVRDICFVDVVAEVAYWFKLKPTRNRAARAPPQRPSACAIVAEAIRLELPEGASKTGERGLEQIWGRLMPWYFQQAERRRLSAGRT